MTSANLMSYEFSCMPTPYSEWTTGSLKPDLGNSPSSPLSSQFDCNSSLQLSSQEQQSSTETTKSAENYVVCSQSMRYALEEIESALMAPDTNEASTSSTPDPQEEKNPVPKQRSITRVPHCRLEKRKRVTNESDSMEVKNLLSNCAQALADDNISDFEALVKETRCRISISGDPIQRLGAYMLEGLVARRQASGSNIYHTLRCRLQPESKDLLSCMSILYDVCPYFKFGYMAAIGAIAEAVRNEDRIHIIDFQIAQGMQWEALIQALAARPGGPPHVRITGIDDPINEHAKRDELQLVGNMLSAMSKKFNIPLEFNALPVYAPDVTREMLHILPGEALAVNFPLQLHHTPDESVDVNNPRDGLLRMVKGLSPKVTTLVEQESNTNTTPFLMRFEETMKYYSAMFESIDVTMSRESKERINVERHCLAKDIVNIIACEGKERIERHEVLGKWRSRFTMAGFNPFPLSSYVNSVIRQLLGHYSDKYTLMETDGALLLGWRNRNLISASAWH